MSQDEQRARAELEAKYREYFIEIRKFSPFPMELSYENVLDFAEWLLKRDAAGT